MNLELLKFPIGPFNKPSEFSETYILEWIRVIETFPNELESLCSGLNIEALNWVYRPNGWSIKQVIHHCGDSHMNSLIRFKLALTEVQPTIRPYYEDLWAKLEDSQDDDISYSLSLLKGLHYRWVKLLKSLTPDQLARTFVHPEHGETFTLVETIANYAWHCNHHKAHIEQAIQYKGSF